MSRITARELDPNFKYDVSAQPGGENIKRCFACGVCTAGCLIREVDEHLDRPYCSSVCCTYAIKEAIVAKEHTPYDLDTTLLFVHLTSNSRERILQVE